MSTRAHVEQARRRAERVPSRRERWGIGVFWAAILGDSLRWLGNIDMLPPLAPLLIIGSALSRDTLFLPFRRRRPKLLAPARTLVPLSELASVSPGTVVHVQGRIQAHERMATYLGTVEDAVYTDLELVGTTPTHLAYRDYRTRVERARPFTLVDGDTSVEIATEAATVVESARRFRLHSVLVGNSLLCEMPLPAGKSRPAHLQQPSITERWLQDGDEVEVLGTVEHRPDSQRESLPREMLTRSALVSSADQPLTIQLLRAR